ncbi:MAG: glycosyltransferase family 9 protein [Gemmatimonadetes bacterium]|nr:glycosyltransferase family 9 protein [Gemmatimonadota bacterium]
MVARLPHLLAIWAINRIYRPAATRTSSSRLLRRVLVSGYTGLGHMVMKTVLLRQIEELYPGCEISIVSGNKYWSAQLMGGYRTLVLPERSGTLERLRFFIALRRERFDAVFLPCDAAPKFLLRGLVLAGIPLRVGHIFEGAVIPNCYVNLQVPVRMEGPRSEIDINLDLLEAVFGGDFERRYVPVLESDGEFPVGVAPGLVARSYVAVQVGAANGMPTTKRWLEPHFVALFQRLLAEHPSLHIVALGDSGDSPIVNHVCDAVESSRVHNLAGQTDLAETSVLISQARFLICHDSGLLHLGNSTGVPVIAIYGPSDVDWYTSQLPDFHLLQEPCECPKLGLFPGAFGEPEEAEAAKRCPVPKCMQRLSVDRVLATCNTLMAHTIEEPGA